MIFTSINAGRNEVWERYEKDNDRKRETKREDDERMSERREGADDEFFFQPQLINLLCILGDEWMDGWMDRNVTSASGFNNDCEGGNRRK